MIATAMLSVDCNQDGRKDVGQDVAADDAEMAESDGARSLHIVFGLDRQRLSARHSENLIFRSMTLWWLRAGMRLEKLSVTA
jgi:hypothetical protein